MHFVEKEPSQKRLDFDQKLKSNKILRVPGAYNPLTAKLIEEIGYDAVYVSGGVMANDLGFPDIGLTTLQDVSTRSYLISRVTNLPTIVDIDTGFKSCKETIETFEEFGISAVHIEDQIERKRCGHLDNKELISKDAMVKKTGIAYVYYDDRVTTDIQTYTGLNDDEFTLIVENDGVEVIEHEELSITNISDDGVETQSKTHELKISRALPDGDLAVKSIPPEDFFVDRSARSISEYYICGHTSDMTMADLFAMGFTEEELQDVNNLSLIHI